MESGSSDGMHDGIKDDRGGDMGSQRFSERRSGQPALKGWNDVEAHRKNGIHGLSGKASGRTSAEAD